MAYEYNLKMVKIFFKQIVVLKTSTAKAATPDILKTHSISSAMSDDLAT